MGLGRPHARRAAEALDLWLAPEVDDAPAAAGVRRLDKSSHFASSLGEEGEPDAARQCDCRRAEVDLRRGDLRHAGPVQPHRDKQIATLKRVERVNAVMLLTIEIRPEPMRDHGRLLGDRMKWIADRFWGNRKTDLQFRGEIARFAAFLSETGYTPDVDHPDNEVFLSHWRGGALPKGLERHPVTWVSLFDALQERIQQGQDYHDLLRQAVQVPLLILDDVDKLNPSEFREETLYTILNGRSVSGLPTALTCNHPPDALAPWIGGAGCSRLMQGLIPVPMEGPDYRLEVQG